MSKLNLKKKHYSQSFNINISKNNTMRDRYFKTKISKFNKKLTIYNAMKCFVRNYGYISFELCSVR